MALSSTPLAFNHTEMLRNYLKVLWRLLLRHKTYSILNILGLSTGLAVFITILIYANHEKSYDQWHAGLANVYRLGVEETEEGEVQSAFWTSYTLGNRIAGSCPEVKAITRIVENGEQLVSSGENRFYETRTMLADSTFFTVYPYSFLKGNPATALNAPGLAVITPEIATKYFGQEDPIGKKITVSTTYTAPKTYTISGVIEQKGPSHLNFNICLSYFQKGPEAWGRRIFTTYLLLQPGSSQKDLMEKMRQIYIKGEAQYALSNMEGEAVKSAPDAEQWLRKNLGKTEISLFLEPAASIHLSPRAAGWRDSPSNHPLFDSQAGNRAPVLFFSIAAILILVLACINYTNLSISLAAGRTKESGIRKVMGSSRKQLIIQFLGETLIQCFLALLIALFLSHLSIGIINKQFGLNLSLWNNLNPDLNLKLILQLLLVVLFVTILAGGYPALILSSFRPASVLKGRLSQRIRGNWVRNSLVVVQFSISACFLIGLAVVYLQIRHMRNTDPGFSTSQVLVLTPFDRELISPGREKNKYGTIKQQLSRLPGVMGVSAGGSYPGLPSVNVQEATYQGKTSLMQFDYVAPDYFKVLNMKVSAGRDFSDQFPSDTINAAIVNETAARQIGGSDILGKKVNILLRDYTIIGVLKDSHTAGYNDKIAPTLYAIGATPGLLGGYMSLLVKVDGGQAGATTEQINALWKTLEPSFPLRYNWLDQQFAKLIERHEQFGHIAGWLATISLAIALTGIFALSAFNASQRKKEISIRKTFGASVTSITRLLSGGFLKMVLLSIAISFPLSYYYMHRWLQDFAYRIPLSASIFIVVGVGLLLISFITVSFLSIKAAAEKPINNLRE